MSGLFILILISCITTVCIGILLIRCLWSLVVNVTSIEGWEIERHRTLLRRAKTFGGYLDGPNGTHIPIRRQEFPYDIGIWKNLTQVFGLNILTWLWPFTTTPENDTGLEFEVNGFEGMLKHETKFSIESHTIVDDNTIWPPPDPDRMPRTRINLVEGYTSIEKGITDLERPEVFLVRQPADAWSGGIQRRKQFHKRYMNQENHEKHYTPSDSQEMGEESWRNAEGERLADFGLDEETEFYDEGNPTTSRLSEHRAGLPMEAHRS